MWSGSNRARATRSQAMGRKPTHPIRYDCCLSQAGFLAYPVQLTEPPNKLTSWSELFSNLGATARDSEACRGAVQIVRIHLPPAESRLRTRLLSEFDHLRGSLGNSNTDASIGQHRHQRERAGEIPAVPHNARSAIAVRGIVPARNRKFDSPLEEAGFELRVPAREKRSFRAVLHGFPAIGPAPAPNPAEHRTLIAPGKRCRRIAGAHILAADADRPVINPAGGIRDSQERGARSTPPRGRIHRRRRCRRRVRATGAPFRRSCEHRPRRECASDRP